ncbi:MAG: SAVED domain-containing protein [Chloroflexaceae bacterium]|nr:SAVED domain-containing protein [Chloroflexaceae bacterium]
MSEEQRVEIGMFTYAPAGKGATLPRRYDWSAVFAPVPPDTFWTQTLLPTLGDVRHELGAAGVEQVDLYAKIHPAVAVAVGYAFRRPAGIHLRVSHPTGATTALWDSAATPAEPHDLRIETVTVGPRTGAITLELGISRDGREVRTAVEQWMQETGTAVYRRVLITPQAGGGRYAVRDNAHAIAIVREISRQIQQVRHTSPGVTIHLFDAQPLAMGVFLGMELNKCGPLQCHIYDSASNSYHPACHLV